MTKNWSAWFVVLTLAGLTPISVAAQSAGTVLQSIYAVDEGGRILVTLQASGPLPLPTSDTVNGPPRIYLDLAGVTPKTKGTQAGPAGSVVKQVRVALNSVSPIVTRVVLDLTRFDSYRVDADERHLGRIRILIGSESGPAAAAPAARAPIPSDVPPATANPRTQPGGSPAPIRMPAPAPTGLPVPAPPPPVSSGITVPAPPPTVPSGITAPAPSGLPAAPTVLPAPAPAVPTGIAKPVAEAGSGAGVPATPPATGRLGRRPILSPSSPARPALPPKEREAYLQQLSGALVRMEARRSIVASIDADENLGATALVTAAQDFSELRRILEKITPSTVAKPTHGLLITSCTLGEMAANLRIDAARTNSTEPRAAAASAAAGSLMFFDLACADLGCNRAPR